MAASPPPMTRRIRFTGAITLLAAAPALAQPGPPSVAAEPPPATTEACHVPASGTTCRVAARTEGR